MTASGADEEEPSGLTRVTVNLIPKSWRDLNKAQQISEDTRTMTINRAIQLYAWWLEQAAAGHQLIVRETDGTVREVKML